MYLYEYRAIDEKTELDAKLEKLTAFTFTDTFESLTSDERSRFNRQHDAMTEYSKILGERIAAFS